MAGFSLWPFRGGRYDLSRIGGSYARLAYDPDYRARAWSEFGSRYEREGLRAFIPRTARYAEAQTNNFTGYRKKADGGYDYFVNGHPASLEDFIMSGGTPPPDEPALQPPPGGGQAPPVSSQDIGAYYGGGYQEPVFQPVYFEGQWYEDPAALSEAMLASAQRKAQERETSVEEEYQRNIAEIERQRQRLLEELPRARREAYSALRGYYRAISPDVYQSRQELAESDLEQRIRAMEEDKLTALQRAAQQAQSSLKEAQRSIQDWLEGWQEQAGQYASYGWKQGQPLPQLTPPEVRYQRATYSIDIPALLEQVRKAPGSRVVDTEKTTTASTRRKRQTSVKPSALEEWLYKAI